MAQNLFDLVAVVLEVPPQSLTLESGPATVSKWDSLAHVTIVSAMEQTYGVELSMPEILAIRTIADLALALERHGGANTTPATGSP